MAGELSKTRNASSVFVKKKRYGRISTWLGHLFRMGNNENKGVMDTKWRLQSKRAKSRLLGSVQKKWLTQFYTSAQEVRRGDAEAVEPPEYHQREAKKTWSPSQSLSKSNHSLCSSPKRSTKRKTCADHKQRTCAFGSHAPLIPFANINLHWHNFGQWQVPLD